MRAAPFALLVSVLFVPGLASLGQETAALALRVGDSVLDDEDDAGAIVEIDSSDTERPYKVLLKAGGEFWYSATQLRRPPAQGFGAWSKAYAAIGIGLAATIAMVAVAWQRPPTHAKHFVRLTLDAVGRLSVLMGGSSQVSAAAVAIATRAQRKNIVLELISTERTYVAKLAGLLGGIDSKLGPRCTDTDRRLLFDGLRPILELNAQFLDQLTARISSTDSWADETCIADIFLRFSDFFKIYVPYTNNLDKVQARHIELRRTKSGARFLEQAKLVAGEDLLSLLILPVQRIPRYRLILEELRKSTPRTHPDDADLSRALEKIKDIASHLNENKRIDDHANQLLQRQKELQRLTPTLELLSPARRLLHEEVCNQCLCEDHNRCTLATQCTAPREVALLVFNDSVLWATIQGGSGTLWPLASAVSTATAPSATTPASSSGLAELVAFVPFDDIITIELERTSKDHGDEKPSVRFAIRWRKPLASVENDEIRGTMRTEIAVHRFTPVRTLPKSVGSVARAALQEYNDVKRQRAEAEKTSKPRPRAGTTLQLGRNSAALLRSISERFGRSASS